MHKELKILYEIVKFIPKVIKTYETKNKHTHPSLKFANHLSFDEQVFT